GCCALVLEDHAPIRVLRAFAYVLATDESETRRPRIIGWRRGARAADSAAAAFFVHEAIPIDATWLEVRDEHSTRVVRFRDGTRRCSGEHSLEFRIFSDLNGQAHDGRRLRGGVARPQEHAVRRWIAGCDALLEIVTSLYPRRTGRRWACASPGQGGAHCGGRCNESTTCQTTHEGSSFALIAGCATPAQPSSDHALSLQ